MSADTIDLSHTRFPLPGFFRYLVSSPFDAYSHTKYCLST